MLGPRLFTWVLLAAAVTCARAQQVPPVGHIIIHRNISKFWLWL
ncbi:Asah1 [Phodopus roborovskii]|uniref:Asah1 protein n=1 Tax=Phodopus roborovskii TaxID=109678 RepID=A0AAU9Z5L8_PHORO|nr:Asah1 [Phodopus roborovskii]